MTDPTTMTDTVPAGKARADKPAKPATGGSPLREKLAAFRAEHGGDQETVLPRTGLTVTYPGFLSHRQTMDVYRMLPEGDRRSFAAVAVAKLCRFEGEKLTDAEVESELPAADVTHLLGLMMDDVAGVGPAGN